MDKPRKKASRTRPSYAGSEETNVTPGTNSILPGADVKNFDRRLVRYLWWLVLMQMLVGEREPVGEHCLKQVAWRLSLFTESGRPEDRHACWKSVHEACGWLEQMDQGGRS
jgi:hypothetical protein